MKEMQVEQVCKEKWKMMYSCQSKRDEEKERRRMRQRVSERRDEMR